MNTIIWLGAYMSRYWAIASGGESRNLGNLFYKYGAAFLGSGGISDYNKNRELFEKEKKSVVRFINEMKEGDKILLKNGISEVLSAGIVNSDEYKFSPAFEDVYGFNISNIRFVDWYVLSNRQQKSLSHTQFAIKKFFKVTEEEQVNIANYIIKNGQLVNKTPQKLPEEGKDYKIIDSEKLRIELMKLGLSFSAAEDLIFEIDRIKKLAEWYDNEGKDISEYETIAFLILPILRILGWSPKQLKLELKRADIVAYKMPYTEKINTKNCEFILEAKEPEQGLGNAIEQVKEYAEDHFPSCNTLAASNGYVYEILKRNKETWETYAYMNLQLYDRCPFNPEVGGTIEVLQELMPSS
jgi:hypothetical protein